MHQLVSESKATEWLNNIQRKTPVEGFLKHKETDQEQCMELAHQLCQVTSGIFPSENGLGQDTTMWKKENMMNQYLIPLNILKKLSNNTQICLQTVLRIIEIIPY